MSSNPEQSTDRAIKAVELRIRGYNYDQIAEALEYSDRSGAYRAVQRVMKERKIDAADAYVSLELDRLDRMAAGIVKDAFDGNLSAIDRMLKIMERRSKYIGGDAAIKLEHSGGTDNTMVIGGVAVTADDLEGIAALKGAGFDNPFSESPET